MAVNDAQPGSKPSLRDARVVSLLPGYVADIEDWMSLGSVCRSIRSDLLQATTPHQHLQLAYASRRVFFRPNPGFLFVHLAKPLSTWSSYSQANLRRFIEAVWLGHEAVLELAVSIPQVALLAGWNQGKPRELCEWRMRVVNPLVDLLDKCVGEQWRAQEQFWDQPDAFTLEADPPAMLFHLIMYGEMFGDAWREAIWAAYGADKGRRGATGTQLEPAESTKVERKDLPPHVSLATRLECLKYLLPDWHLPRQPGDWRDITSTRSIRPDEYVYIRPTADDADKRPQQLSSTDATGVQPVMRSLTHPLRDVRTDMGPYQDHWTSNATVDRPSGEATTWAVAQRASAEEHVSAVRHLLQSSVQWLSLSRDFRGHLDAGVWPGSLTGVVASSEGDPGGSAATAGRAGSSTAAAEVDERDGDDENDEDNGDWPPESLHTRMSAAPWMFGLRGAEMLAAYLRYRNRPQGADPQRAADDGDADPSLTDRTATASHLDVPVDISRVDASVVDTSHAFSQTILRAMKVRTRDLGPVQVRRMTCYEIPDLLAEAIVLMQQ